jgi:hypothetical protein
MRTILTVSAALTLAFFALASGSALAKNCRDAAGKFIKCPAAAAPTKCRNSKTKKFAKCAIPGTEAVP